MDEAVTFTELLFHMSLTINIETGVALRFSITQDYRNTSQLLHL